MSKLMEHGNDVGEADQGGFAGGGLGQVGNVVHDRGGSKKPRLANEFRHPGSAVLVVALEVIAVEKGEVLAIGVEDFEDPYIGLVNGNVVPFLEGDSVELICGVEHSVLEHVVEFEIGLHLRIVDVVASLADLLSVEVPIVRLNLEATLLGVFLAVDDSLNICGFAVGLCGCGGDDSIHELQCGFRCLRHLINEFPSGEARITKEFGLPRAKLSETCDGVARIVGVAPLGAVPGVFEYGLTRPANAERNKVRLLRGILERDYEAFDFSVFGSVFGGLCGRGDASFRQTGERRFVGGDVGAGFRGGQESGVEGVRQRRKFFVELPQFSLVGFREFSARMYELVVGTLQQAERLGIKLERGALLIDRRYAREKFRVEVKEVPMSGKFRRLDGFDILKRGVCVCLRNSVESRYCTFEQSPTLLHGDDGIVEGRSLGVVSNPLDFGFCLRHASLDRGLEVLVLDLVEGWRLEGQSTGRVKRIGWAEGRGCSESF